MENKIEDNIKPEKRTSSSFFFCYICYSNCYNKCSYFILEFKGTYTRINPITNELQPYLVTVESLLTREGLQYMFSSVLKNFMSFAPLAMSLIFLMV